VRYTRISSERSTHSTTLGERQFERLPDLIAEEPVTQQ